ncbi:16285_t:CDS:2 [Entrophospora sp. SA101]|nr:16285_t:CDS:2 [Entrophospora sp. SA101]
MLQTSLLGELHKLFIKIRRKKQYDHRTDGDDTISEATFLHDVIDKIMFCCIQVVDEKVHLRWEDQAEDGNVNYESHLSYDKWLKFIDKI